MCCSISNSSLFLSFCLSPPELFSRQQIAENLLRVDQELTAARAHLFALRGISKHDRDDDHKEQVDEANGVIRDLQEQLRKWWEEREKLELQREQREELRLLQGGNDGKGGFLSWLGFFPPFYLSSLLLRPSSLSPPSLPLRFLLSRDCAGRVKLPYFEKAGSFLCLFNLCPLLPILSFSLPFFFGKLQFQK